MLSVNNQRRPSVGTNVTSSMSVRSPSDGNVQPFDGEIEPSTWTLDRVLEWLDDNSFSEYKSMFMENNLCGEQFFALGNIKTIKNIVEIGDSNRYRLINAIRKIGDVRPKRQSFSNKGNQPDVQSPHPEGQSSKSINEQNSPTTPTIQAAHSPTERMSKQKSLKLSTSFPDLRSVKGPIGPKHSSIGWQNNKNNNSSNSTISTISETDPSSESGALPVNNNDKWPKSSVHNNPSVIQKQTSEDIITSPSDSKRKAKGGPNSFLKIHDETIPDIGETSLPKYIQVTFDSKTFRVVDLSGREDPSTIKETIFSQFEIPQSEREHYSFHSTEIGQKEIGPTIDDETLIHKCKKADDRGTLKLLIKQRQLSDPYYGQSHNQERRKAEGEPIQHVHSPDRKTHYRTPPSSNLRWDNYPNSSPSQHRGDVDQSPKNVPLKSRPLPSPKHPFALQPSNSMINTRRPPSRESILRNPDNNTRNPPPPSIPPKPSSVTQKSQQQSLMAIPGVYMQYISKSQPHLPLSQNPLAINQESEHYHNKLSESDLPLRKHQSFSQPGKEFNRRIVQGVFPEDDEPRLCPKITLSSQSEANRSNNKITSPTQKPKNRLERTVSLRRGVTESWVVRPTAEDLFEQLDQYFPGHDLDKPIVPERKIQIGKSIRAAAREAHEREKREKTERNNKLAGVVNKIKTHQRFTRKPTTKLWDKKILVHSHKKPSPDVPGEGVSAERAPVMWVKGELIGEGAFGKVFLAMNMNSSEIMAVKQQRVSKSNLQKVKSFTDEIEILKDLDHIHIVQYLGFERTEEVINIFLEYANGGSISTCLRVYGAFKEPVVRSFTRQILLGLQYLHNRGILHRDIKADNILVDEEGCCKISDFGISKFCGLSPFVSEQGTIFWMAPEVFSSTNGYNAKVDIWSLGCVVLEMFAGERPWSGLTDLAAMCILKYEKKAPPIRGEFVISSEARSFLDQCFILEPDNRPTAEQLLQHPFAQENPNFHFKKYISI